MPNQKDRRETSAKRATKVLKSRTLVLAAVLGVATFAALLCRLYYLQIVRHEELQEKAVAQQTRSSTISASRGTIYEANGETVVKQKAEQDEADQVREFINEKEIKGIYLVPDSKRYYPFGSLASQVIGFVSSDNVGLYGIEALYEEELEGTAGLVVTEKNARGEDVLYKYEQYYDAQDGDSLVLTIDATIQHYLEQGLEDAIEKYDVKNGATGIVMNVKTGAILAMASLPNYLSLIHI